VFYPIWEAASLDEWLYNGGPYQLIVCHFFLGICTYMGREWELSFRLGFNKPLSFCKLRYCTGFIVKETKFILNIFFFLFSNTFSLLNQDNSNSLDSFSEGESTSEKEGSGVPSPPEQDPENKKKKIFKGVCPSVEWIKSKTLELAAQGSDAYLDFIAGAKIRAQDLLKIDPTTYCEMHHVVPKFQGGSNDSSNLVLLTFEDHAVAHYIRWVTYGNPADEIAWNVMSGQCEDIRRERAKLGGKIGGKIAQEQHKKNNVGWFNSEGQKERGIKGAAVNRAQGTGAWDPKNLIKAREVIANNPDIYRPAQLKALEQGRATQRALGINTSDSAAQRLKSIKRFGFIELAGKKYSIDTEQRTYICETTLLLTLCPFKKT